MYVRLTYLNFLPEKFNESRKIYEEELVPQIRKQHGNLDARLLEPVDRNDDYISMTTWETKEDSDQYHNSGLYKKLVNRVKDTFSKEPQLKVYTTEEVAAHA